MAKKKKTPKQPPLESTESRYAHFDFRSLFSSEPDRDGDIIDPKGMTVANTFAVQQPISCSTDYWAMITEGIYRARQAAFQLGARMTDLLLTNAVGKNFDEMQAVEPLPSTAAALLFDRLKEIPPLAHLDWVEQVMILADALDEAADRRAEELRAEAGKTLELGTARIGFSGGRERPGSVTYIEWEPRPPTYTGYVERVAGDYWREDVSRIVIEVRRNALIAARLLPPTPSNSHTCATQTALLRVAGDGIPPLDPKRDVKPRFILK